MNSKKSLSVKLFLLISLFCFAFASLMLVLPNNTVETAYAAAVGYEASWNGSTFTWIPSQPSEINAGDTLYVTSDKTSNTVICSYDNKNITAHKTKSLNFESEHRYSVEAQSNTITLTRLSYSVKYDGNGATSGSAPDSTEYAQNASVTVLGNTGSLENTGYAFAGWNTQANGEGTDYAVGSNFTMPATDITLYAQWEDAKTTIELDTTPQRFAYTGNEVNINLIDNSTKVATDIAGFIITYSQRNNDGSSYTSVTNVVTPGSYKATITREEDSTYCAYSQDIIFYVSYSVTYKANGGTGADYVDISSGTEYYADSSIGSNIGNAYPKTTGITPFTKEGYTFDTWNTKADGTGTVYDTNAGFTEYLTENISIYACYSANIKTQPTSSNDYSVEIDTTDEVTYQWYKCQYSSSSTPGKLVAGNENGGVITSSSKTIAFGCGKFDAVQFETTATLKEGVRGVDGLYIYLITKFGMKGCAIEITSDEEFTISNIQWLTISDVEVTGETSSKLTNADENTLYYCSIKSKYNAITNSQRVTTSAAIFKGNSSTGGTAPQTLFGLKGGKITIPSNTFEKTGYDFLGWNTDSSATSGLTFTDNKYTMGDSNVTFYAIWGHKHGNSGDAGYIEFSLPITYDYLNGLTNNGDGNTELSSGNYFLTANTTLDSNIKNLIIPSGQTVNICLNGYTLDLVGYYIQNNGTLTIYDCQNAGIIKGDKTNKQGYYSAELNYQGGAIYNNAGTLTINGGTFTENYADQGGAIYNNNGAITINAGTFDQNIAYISGGAIYNNSGTLTINGGTFTNNSASGSKHTYGGAIYIAGGTVNISGATFGGASGKGNLSHTGGAIYNLATLTIGNSTIISNNGGAKDGETKTGGAIFNDGTLTISDGTISYNSSIFVGGAISNSGNGTLTISGGTISNNTSEDGGAICNDGTLIIIGGTIKDNSATNSSGGIYNEYVKDGNDVLIRGTITVGGSAIISGNIVNSKANNVYLVDNTSLTVGVDANVPTSTMSVGITLESGYGTFVTGDTTNNKNYFTSDNSIYVVSVAEVAGSPKTYSYSLEQKYSVSYDDNTDDTVTNMPTQDDNLYLSGEKVTISSNIPVREGYNFLGWNTNKDAEVALTFTDNKYTIETSNVTFYAIWEDKYYSKGLKITVGAITEYSEAKDIVITTDRDSELTLESVHILQPLATGGAEYTNSISKPSEYMLLIVYTVKDGKAFKKGKSGYDTSYINCTGCICGGTMVASAFDFSKMYDADEFATPGTTIDDNKKLLVFLAVEVTGGNLITFAPNTADTITGLPGPTTYLKGTPITLPTPSSRTYYNFLGWNTDKGATAALTFDDNKYIMGDSAVIFYAVWKVIPHIHSDITFDEIIFSSFTGGPLITGNYYLVEDLTINSPLKIVGNAVVNLCLNGHKIVFVRESQSDPHQIFPGATFSIYADGNDGKNCKVVDTITEGIVLSPNVYKNTFNIYGIMNVNGVYIKGDSVFYLYQTSTLNINDSTIIGECGYDDNVISSAINTTVNINNSLIKQVYGSNPVIFMSGEGNNITIDNSTIENDATNADSSTIRIIDAIITLKNNVTIKSESNIAIQANGTTININGDNISILSNSEDKDIPAIKLYDESVANINTSTATIKSINGPTFYSTDNYIYAVASHIKVNKKLSENTKYSIYRYFTKNVVSDVILKYEEGNVTEDNFVAYQKTTDDHYYLIFGKTETTINIFKITDTDQSTKTVSHSYTKDDNVSYQWYKIKKQEKFITDKDGVVNIDSDNVLTYNAETGFWHTTYLKFGLKDTKSVKVFIPAGSLIKGIGSESIGLFSDNPFSATVYDDTNSLVVNTSTYANLGGIGLGRYNSESECWESVYDTNNEFGGVVQYFILWLELEDAINYTITLNNDINYTLYGAVEYDAFIEATFDCKLSYIGTVSETAVNGETSATLSNNVKTAGIYICKVTADGVTLTSDEIIVSIAAIEQPSNKNGYEFITNTPNGDSASYQWYNAENDEQVEGKTSSKFGKITEAGEFYCIATYEGISITSNSIIARKFSFDVNGATGTTPNDVFYFDGSKVSFPGVGDLVLSGYNLLGWNTSKTATVALSNYVVDGEGATFYAIWVDKLIVSIDETKQTYTYNGKDQGFEIKGTHKDIGSFVVKYYVDDTWTTTAPINAGIYDVKITRATDDTYAAYEKEIEDGFTINKFNVTVTIDKTSFVYNGEDQQTGLKATYKDVNDQDIALTLDYVTPKDFNSLGFINAGNYIASFVFATIDESTNYSLGEYEDYEAEIAIDKKEIVIDWCEDNFTYNGNEQVIKATYKDVKGVSIDLGVGYSAQFKDAGKYTATVLFKNNETNYKLPSTITKEFTMKKQKVNEPTIKSTYIYAGQPIVPEFNGVLDCMVIKEGATAQNEPGFYKTEFTLDSNHEWAEGSDGFVDWKILKQEDEYVEPEKEEAQVKVEYKEGFDPNISLQVKVTEKEEIPKTELTVDYNNLQKEEIKLKANEVVGVVFDVKLIRTVDGVDSVIQPSDIKAGATITVKFTIPDYVNVDKISRILHVHTPENIESIEFNKSSYDSVSRYYTMETDSFSEFAFIYFDDSIVEPTKDSKDLTPGAIAGITIGSILGFILILFITLFILWKNEFDEEQKYIEESKKVNVDVELEVKSQYTRKLKFLDPVYRPINHALFGGKKKA